MGKSILVLVVGGLIASARAEPKSWPSCGIQWTHETSPLKKGAITLPNLRIIATTKQVLFDHHLKTPQTLDLSNPIIKKARFEQYKEYTVTYIIADVADLKSKEMNTCAICFKSEIMKIHDDHRMQCFLKTSKPFSFKKCFV